MIIIAFLWVLYGLFAYLVQIMNAGRMPMYAKFLWSVYFCIFGPFAIPLAQIYWNIVRS